MKTTRLTSRILFLAMAAMLVLGFGCNTSKPTPDPLAGFHAAYGKVDQSIVNDYQNYIQTLSPEEKKYLGPYPGKFFEDGTGRHAVQIEVDLQPNAWYHVLIYDKDDKRIKTVKYVDHQFRS
jgi:hypothetical protein